jgi:fatty acid-binding protein DegV
VRRCLPADDAPSRPEAAARTGPLLLTDSSTGVQSQSLPGLRCVPIHFRFADGEASEDDARSLERAYRELADGRAVASSAPTPLDYLAAIEGAEAPSVVVVTPAEELSTMYRNACIAAEMAEREVVVVDSRSAAAGQALVVLEAWKAARAGMPLDRITRCARRAIERADVVIRVGFPRGRRAAEGPQAARPAGASTRRAVPVLRLRMGCLSRLGVAATVEASTRMMHGEWLAKGGPEAAQTIVFHSRRPREAERLRRLLAHPGVLTTELSPAMASHFGMDVIGVAWLRP